MFLTAKRFITFSQFFLSALLAILPFIFIKMLPRLVVWCGTNGIYIAVFLDEEGSKHRTT